MVGDVTVDEFTTTKDVRPRLALTEENPTWFGILEKANEQGCYRMEQIRWSRFPKGCATRLFTPKWETGLDETEVEVEGRGVEWEHVVRPAGWRILSCQHPHNLGIRREPVAQYTDGRNSNQVLTCQFVRSGVLFSFPFYSPWSLLANVDSVTTGFTPVYHPSN